MFRQQPRCHASAPQASNLSGQLVEIRHDDSFHEHLGSNSEAQVATRTSKVESFTPTARPWPSFQHQVPPPLPHLRLRLGLDSMSSLLMRPVAQSATARLSLLWRWRACSARTASSALEAGRNQILNCVFTHGRRRLGSASRERSQRQQQSGDTPWAETYSGHYNQWIEAARRLSASAQAWQEPQQH